MYQHYQEESIETNINETATVRHQYCFQNKNHCEVYSAYDLADAKKKTELEEKYADRIKNP